MSNRNDKVKSFSEKVDEKEIVIEQLGDFPSWLKEKFGITLAYHELKALAVQLFWSRYIYELKEERVNEQLEKVREEVDKNSSEVDGPKEIITGEGNGKEP
jgi:hypothetical protein